MQRGRPHAKTKAEAGHHHPVHRIRNVLGGAPRVMVMSPTLSRSSHLLVRIGPNVVISVVGFRRIGIFAFPLLVDTCQFAPAVEKNATWTYDLSNGRTKAETATNRNLLGYKTHRSTCGTRVPKGQLGGTVRDVPEWSESGAPPQAEEVGHLHPGLEDRQELQLPTRSKTWALDGTSANCHTSSRCTRPLWFGRRPDQSRAKAAPGCVDR